MYIYNIVCHRSHIVLAHSLYTLRVREYVYVIHIQDKISKTGVRNISIVSKDTREAQGRRDASTLLRSYDRQIVSPVRLPRSTNKFEFAFQRSGSTFRKQNGNTGDVYQFIC